MNFAETLQPLGPTPLDRPTYRRWSLAVVTLIAIALASPSLLIDQEPYNFDESAFLSTGTYFSSAIQDLGGFLSNPAQWSKDYYNQYPAISLRRHPPLFFAFEGLFYTLFGTNYIAGRLALLLFTVAMSTGFFLVALRYFKDSAMAITATLILLAVTCPVPVIQEVWLDVPTMAWAIWALYFWDLWRTEHRLPYGIGFGLCCLCALYTYQLSLFLVVAMFGVAGLYWLWPKINRSSISKTKPFPGYRLVAIGFFVLLLPLVIFTILLGKDQLQVAAGGQLEEYARFSKANSTFSVENMTFYLKNLAQFFPIALIGTAFFLLSRLTRQRKFLALDSIMLAATIITYAGFTIVSSGGTRYAWYIVVPTVLWSADFLGWLSNRIAPKSWQAALCIAAASLLLVESGSRDYSKRFFREPVDMQRAFDLVREQKNLLYSGTFDARFIFTVRGQDPNRSRHLFRGTVQVKDKEDIASFLAKNKIDAVLVQRSQEGKVVAEHQRLEQKLTDQLPSLGFNKVETLYGHEIGDADVPMLDVYLKR
jgi:hypothetical protein